MIKIECEKDLNICSRHKKQTTFSGQKSIGGIRVKVSCGSRLMFMPDI